MRDVAKVVKRRLNEGMYDFDYSNSIDSGDEYVRGRERKENDRQERIANLKSRYDTVDTLENGLTIITNERGKYNLISPDGYLIFDRWFDFIGNFKNGYGKIQAVSQSQHRILNNFIDKNGNLVSDDKWFDEIGSFHEGLARVKINKKWNFIATNGKIISDEWFDGVSNFKDGYAIVCVCEDLIHRMKNVINSNGKFMLDDWQDYCCPNNNGEIMVMRRTGTGLQYGKYDSNGRFNGKWRDVDRGSAEWKLFFARQDRVYNMYF